MAIIRLPVRFFMAGSLQNRKFQMGENEEVDSGQPMIMTTSQEIFSTNPIFLSENQRSFLKIVKG